MNEHEHRPTSRNYNDRRGHTRCLHCGRPLKCVNSWGDLLTMIPVLVFFIFFLAPTGMSMKEALPILLALFVLTALLRWFTFRFLKFEIDVVAEYEENQQDFLRRRR